jgi:homoserine dehydrogenase
MLKIALLGFGNVGRAFARYAREAGVSCPISIRAVADSSGGILIEDPESIEYILAQKQAGRSLHDIAPSDVIEDSREFLRSLVPAGITALVESLPTNMTNGQPALARIREALGQGISVVTVDKGPLVHGLRELEEAARLAGAHLGYSGATGVRFPEELSGLAVQEIRGVLNGTTNYILTQMQEASLGFETALAQAQAQGIAEPDPSLDLEGWDTACKILILASAHMGASSTLGEVSRIGIGPQTEGLIETARQTGRKVRLLGRARIWQGRVRLSVAPKILSSDSPFFSSAGTSKAAVFTTKEKGDVLVSAQSGRDSISRTIMEDLLRIDPPTRGAVGR